MSRFRAFFLAAAGLIPAAAAYSQTSYNPVLTLRAGMAPRTYSDKLSEIANPADFLAPGQTAAQLEAGTIDAQPSFTAAILAAGSVRPPCGTYRLDEGFSFGVEPVVIDGRSPGCVTFNVNFSAGDIFLLTSTQNAIIEHIRVNALAQRTSGAVFHALNTYGIQFDDVQIEGPNAADGWLLDGANTVHISHYDCRPPVPFVVGTFGAGACIHGVNNFADVHIAHGNTASWHYGMQLTYGSGWYADDVDQVVSGNAVLIDPSYELGQSIYGVQLGKILGDTSYGDNFLFLNDGWITDVQMTTPWASNSQGGNGIAINNARVDGLQIVSPTILLNHGHGLAALLGTNITVTGIHSMMNSQFGSNLWDDIYIGNTVAAIAIIGGHTGFGTTGRAIGSAMYSRWGLNAQGGGSGQTITVVGLTGYDHVTGFMNVSGVTSPSVLNSVGNSGN